MLERLRAEEWTLREIYPLTRIHRGIEGARLLIFTIRECGEPPPTRGIPLQHTRAPTFTRTSICIHDTRTESYTGEVRTGVFAFIPQSRGTREFGVRKAESCRLTLFYLPLQREK